MTKKTVFISTPANEIIRDNFFVNSNQIMKIFGITRNTLAKWKKTEGFPKTLYLSKRPLWVTQDVIKWAMSFDEKNPLWKLFDENN
jgi:predicted DNA-binding transcriptional regulator AlpA